MKRALFAGAALCLVASCLGRTEYNLVTFYAAGAGPGDAVAGQPYPFTSDLGWHVVLTKAKLHVGAIYLDQSVPSSGAGPAPCTLPGTYVGEVRQGGDIDMLDPAPQGFPTYGEGSTIEARVGQVWLTGGDVNANQDPTVVLSVAGTADKGGMTFPFTGDLTISQNRTVSSGSSATPGADPICVQRIVTPILADVTLSQSGTLVLRLDPKELFLNVDFSALPMFSNGYGFTDDSSNQPSVNLYQNLRSAGGAYRFEWQP
jgi:hypothetical protein